MASTPGRLISPAVYTGAGGHRGSFRPRPKRVAVIVAGRGLDLAVRRVASRLAPGLNRRRSRVYDNNNGTTGAANLQEHPMIVLGVILLLIGYFTGISILYTIGGILVVIGVVLWILGAVGRPVGGRKVWF